jgi:hypothetical protein
METRNLTLHTLRYHSSVSARPGKKEKYRLRQRSACMHYFARTNSINSAYYHMQEAFRPRLLQPYSAPTKSTSITCTSITSACLLAGPARATQQAAWPWPSCVRGVPAL